MSLLTTYLAGRRQLLVLDNLEHLLDAGPIVSEILVSCPGITLLVTSRVRLELSGEHLFPVGPLEADAARDLFVARARAVNPALTMSPETQSAVDAICLRVDRVPLAIELAAARSNALSPIAMLNRLDNRLEMLTDGPRDVPGRMRTTRDSIAWSYELLAPEQQSVFRQIGVFVGGFAPEAAEALTGMGSDTFRHITSLVGASLVIPIEGVGDDPRFTMLATIREYALEALAAGGEEPEFVAGMPSTSSEWRRIRFRIMTAQNSKYTTRGWTRNSTTAARPWPGPWKPG